MVGLVVVVLMVMWKCLGEVLVERFIRLVSEVCGGSCGCRVWVMLGESLFSCRLILLI